MEMPPLTHRAAMSTLLVEGSEANLKVTTPADLAHFRFLRSQQR